MVIETYEAHNFSCQTRYCKDSTEVVIEISFITLNHHHCH
jgi:hypothetical protein